MNENIVIIVQARLGSTRLPGKVLKPLNGYPVLEHVLERCAAILGREHVICAGVDKPSEAPIRALAERLGIEFFAGDEQDVLSRYYHAAKSRNADWVVRVTSDCPLLDPAVCRGLIEKVITEDADFGITEGWPHGLDCEVIRFAVLEQSFLHATDPLHREHVTLWAKANQKIKKCSYRPEMPSAHSSGRWVLDYEEDYQFLSTVFTELNIQPGKNIDWKPVADFIGKNPVLLVINRHRINDWKAANKRIEEVSNSDR